VTELAIAAYAAETGRHLLSAPRDRRFGSFVDRFDEREYLRGLEALGLRWVGRSDPGFPAGLAAIFDPPAGLFLRGRGEVGTLDTAAVAVVGARSCSAYGAQVARMVGRDLAAAGLVVVSGMARGIDGEAHRGALEAGGRSVAVLGCGIDRDYPAAHADLARRICAHGLVVSEYAPGVEPAPWRFPARNRIIAGLAAVTIVVEARERSGALITADLALEEGREVFAVPGEITSALSAGTNRMLAAGAAPLTQVADVLRSFGVEPAEAPAVCVGDDATRVLAALRDSPAAADELPRSTGLDAAALAAALSELEVAGLAVEAAGVYRASVVTQTTR
jgi:DNA processing protein